LIAVLEEHFPAWRALTIHESSPGGPASEKLARECQGNVATQFLPDTPPGAAKDGVRCEDLEALTSADGSFDLVVTQDVFEHVLDPARGFREMARTLKPGGAHVFTIPWYSWKDTRIRAVREKGAVRHLVDPDYHRNPIDPRGSLVVPEWGRDFCEFIEKHSGLKTRVVRLHDRRRGIDGEFREVFISRKDR
jgi:SAM-dependent methyltransferase